MTRTGRCCWRSRGTLRECRAGCDDDPVPRPDLSARTARLIPASHMNFTITNGAVLVPVYEDHYSLVALAGDAGPVPGPQDHRPAGWTYPGWGRKLPLHDPRNSRLIRRIREMSRTLTVASIQFTPSDDMQDEHRPRGRFHPRGGRAGRRCRAAAGTLLRLLFLQDAGGASFRARTCPGRTIRP
jgi:hypothetical protein